MISVKGIEMALFNVKHPAGKFHLICLHIHVDEDSNKIGLGCSFKQIVQEGERRF